MTEITFQFIPPTVEEFVARDVFVDDGSVEHIINKDGNITSVRLSQQRYLEFSGMGSIRFTLSEEDLEGLDLNQSYGLALETIQNVLHIDVSDYCVVLLISDENPARKYLELEEKIEIFSDNTLNCESHEYSEINDNTIKLSFRQKIIA